MTLHRLLLLAVLPALGSAQDAVPFTPGMVITANTKIAPGVYVAPATAGPVVVVRGSNITLDMRGVELVGTADRTRPDRFDGVAVQVDSGSRITIRGASIRGYKVAIMASGTSQLVLRDLNLSYNWKSQLFSGIEKESLIDWMSYHQNEKREWLQRGAAIYLEDVTGGEVKNVTVRQGGNGLLMTGTTGLKIWNNDFSFNSALGIGMYRSSRNVIAHNKIDYNVRGYSHGFYNRGQDSAGLLMYEQSSENVVAYNSVTHSGDGLFLWAGQSTMDTGAGGANDNLFYGNDFSHAPTNGIETTFSRNVFVNNRVEENWHGVWGGYSWQTQFIGNTFRNNAEAIAIEHGQDIRITGNSFEGDTTAIRLWWNRLEPSDWGYPKARDTRSRDYVILGNTFRNVRLALRVENSQRVRTVGNVFRAVDSLTRLVGDTSGWQMQNASNATPAPVPIPDNFKVSRLPGGMNAMIPAGAPRGRNTIIVDEWGPYDWQSPKLWPVGRSDAVPQRLRVLGPKGAWRVVSLDGVVSLSAESGVIGDTLTVVPTGGRENDWRVELEYVGAKVTTPFGELVEAGAPVRFGWGRFIPRVDWRLAFRNLDSAAVVRATAADTATVTRDWLLALPVASALDTTRLDLTWYRPPRAEIKQADLLTEATGTIRLPAGRYLLRTIADDAIRVYLDGVLLLDDWNAGESHRKEVEFVATNAEHQLRVIHLQKDGWYELRLDIERVR